MRVREPDEDNGNKLARILKYLRGTRELVLTLESDVIGTVTWWVDTACVVHHGMNSHTGGMITMGKAPCTPSQTKKLNTRSSNEADLVGVDDLMPQILWMRYFLEAQGMKVYDNVVYQDNQSAMKLEKMEEHQVVREPGISTYVIFHY